MAINYVEKGEALHRAISAAGHWIERRDGVWYSSDDVAVQAIIDSFDPLPGAKALKMRELKTETLRRVQEVFPAIQDADELRLIRNLWSSIAASARQPTTDFAKLIAIDQARAGASNTINAFTTVAQVAAYNVVTAPSWPA